MTATTTASKTTEESAAQTPYQQLDGGQGSSNNNDTTTTTTTQTTTTTTMHRQVSTISMPQEKSGLFGTASNLVNSIVGAGIIGIPYALHNAGFFVGITLLVSVAFMTDKSLRMLVELASFHPKLRHLGVHTYEDLMMIPFGLQGSRFVLAGMLVLAYGAMVAYLLIIKDTVPTILGLTHEAGKGSFWNTEFVMLITSLIIIVPLSLQRDMASLAWTSSVSVLADIVLVGFIVFFSPFGETIDEYGGFTDVVKENWINSRLFIGLGVLSTAMACQHSAFIVSNSLDDGPNPQDKPHRWATVTGWSLSLAGGLCLLLGSTGYLGFLEETQGDILNNFEAGSTAANVGRGLLALTMFFTYPMESLVARHVLVQLLYNGDLDGPLPEQNNSGWFSWGRREQVTIGIYLLTLLPALLVDDLGPVLSLTGALGASFIAYTGVGLAYLGLHGKEFLQYCNTKLLKQQQPQDSTTSAVELSTMGGFTNEADANATSSSTPVAAIAPVPKPWWWYLAGFPFWTAIAQRGAHGTHEFLSQYQSVIDEALQKEQKEGSNNAAAVSIGASEDDFFVSIFFIVFGLIAAVAGCASIVIVELF